MEIESLGMQNVVNTEMKSKAKIENMYQKKNVMEKEK